MSAADFPVSLTRRGLIVSGAAVGLAGCAGLIGPPPAPQLYVLRPDFQALPDAPNVSWQLGVAIPAAPESLDTQRIALMRAPNVMDYYANAAWTDTVPVLVQSLLVEAFERSGKIAAVGRDGQGIRADYILQTEIRDFEAYYAVLDTPPKVIVKLSASMVGALRREVVATLRPGHEIQAAANDLASITAAFAQAAGAALEEIVAWALRAPAPPQHAAASDRRTPIVKRQAKS